MELFDRSRFEQALTVLGDVLESRGHAFEVVLVGGANLLLRGIVTRPTKDGDLLGARLSDGTIAFLPRLPEELRSAVVDVARAYGLSEDWINVGPSALVNGGLPEGFAGRMSHRTYGSALVVWLASEYDLIHFKLYAAADRWPSRDRHLEDLKRLAPTRASLIDAARWMRTHDSSPGFLSQLIPVLHHLGIEDATDVVR